MNLLIVDDEILAIQGLVDDMDWKKLDFDEVFTANSYAQAVNIMNKQEIDVLLCDIEMPLRSGVELVRWAKERNPELECIFPVMQSFPLQNRPFRWAVWIIS